MPIDQRAQCLRASLAIDVYDHKAAPGPRADADVGPWEPPPPSLPRVNGSRGVMKPTPNQGGDRMLADIVTIRLPTAAVTRLPGPPQGQHSPSTLNIAMRTTPDLSPASRLHQPAPQRLLSRTARPNVTRAAPTSRHAKPGCRL